MIDLDPIVEQLCVTYDGEVPEELLELRELVTKSTRLKNVVAILINELIEFSNESPLKEKFYTFTEKKMVAFAKCLLVLGIQIGDKLTEVKFLDSLLEEED